MRIEPRDFDLIDLLDQVADWWHFEREAEGPPSRRLARPRPAAPDHGRSRPPPAGAEQLPRQRGQVHLRRRDHAPRLRTRPRRRAAPASASRSRIPAPGMTPDQQAKLFRPFVQIEIGFRQGPGRLGPRPIHLRQHRQARGRRHRRAERPGEGSIFSFEMDAPVAAQTLARPPARPSSRQREPQDGPKPPHPSGRGQRPEPGPDAASALGSRARGRGGRQRLPGGRRHHAGPLRPCGHGHHDAGPRRPRRGRPDPQLRKPGEGESRSSPVRPMSPTRRASAISRPA
jgi:hypothetical protein